MIDILEAAETGFLKHMITNVYPTGIFSYVADTFDFFRVITTIAARVKPDIMARYGKVVFRPDSGDPADIICGIQVKEFSGTVSFESAQAWFEQYLVNNERSTTPHGECGNGLVSGFFKHDDTVYEMVVEIEWNRDDKQYYYEDGHTIASCDPVTLTPEQKGAVECLWDVFGGTVNHLGFKTLDQHVGLIYGDSISLEVAEDVFKRLIAKGFSSANIVFGIGSFTYQYVTRDSFGAAVKATWGQVKGEGRELFKNPKTDSGMKKSAKGLLRIEKEGEDFVQYDQQTRFEETLGQLKVIFDGRGVIKRESLTGMRERLLSSAA